MDNGDVVDLAFDEWWENFGLEYMDPYTDEVKEIARSLCKRYETDLKEAFRLMVADYQSRKDGDASPVVDETTPPEEGQG